jgi:septum formation protein
MLTLASTSPTRKALLLNAGIAFEAVAPGVNERALEAANLVERADPSKVAMRLAEAKALAVPGAAVIGADQVLELDGVILHKAASVAEARKRLDVLCGRSHRLHTAVALALAGALVWSFNDTSTLTMRSFTHRERDAILAAEGDALLGSAGAYRIEGPSLTLFEKIEGDHFAILGLPLLPLLQALRVHAPQTLELKL